MNIRRSDERGTANHGWLQSKHTFSFAGYHDPAYMGFRSLRVINQDRVQPSGGFSTHPHDNMEIFSYVLEGSLMHRDSMGNQRELKPGEVQLMSAGRGITHSEYNPSSTVPLHFLQIWIHPDQRNLEPSYTEWRPSPEMENESKTLIISPDGAAGSAVINQDAFIYRVRLEPGEEAWHLLEEGRGLWIQVIDGSLSADGMELASGDAMSSEEAGGFSLQAGDQPVEALLFDLG